MLILISFEMNPEKPQGSCVNLFTINWLNLEEPWGEAAVRIRNLVDAAWNYTTDQGLQCFLALRLLIHKDSKTPIFIGPFLESQNMRYPVINSFILWVILCGENAMPFLFKMGNGNLKMKRSRDFIPMPFATLLCDPLQDPFLLASCFSFSLSPLTH